MIEGLAHARHPTQPSRLPERLLLDRAREDEDGKVGVVLPHVRCEVEAAPVGHVEIRDEEREAAESELLPAVPGAGALDDFVPFLREQAGEKPEDGRIVVDGQNSGFGCRARHSSAQS